MPEGELEDAFFGWVAAHDGASTAAYVHRHATREQALELLRLRSVYHLKESDPTAWAVPRLRPRAKAALMELQYDEYGAGRPDRLHAHLFAEGLEACGLDPAYGAYVDEVPLEMLEQNNAMSLFGLHRRLRGAALGHLAAFEATSSMPSRRIAAGHRASRPRAGDGPATTTSTSRRTRCTSSSPSARSAASLVARGAGAARRRLFGACTCLDLEDRLARQAARAVAGRAGAAGGDRLVSGRAASSTGRDRLPRRADAGARRPTWSRTPDGAGHPTTRPVSAVCRCGRSRRPALVRRHPQGPPPRRPPHRADPSHC